MRENILLIIAVILMMTPAFIAPFDTKDTNLIMDWMIWAHIFNILSLFAFACVLYVSLDKKIEQLKQKENE